MNLKIILGIVIPVILIIALSILGSLNVGFSVDEDFERRLSLENISLDGRVRTVVKLGDVTLENDYFLAKRHELPRREACLYDREKIRQEVSAGSVIYSEGDLNVDGTDPFRTVVPYRYASSQSRSVQVQANEKKTVTIYLQPSYDFHYRNITQLLSDYGDYDELIIFEQPNNHYYSCYDLPLDVIEDSVRISLR